MSYKSKYMQVEDDLTWYFCFSESEIGLKSNWGAMVSASMFGSQQWHDPYSAFALSAIDRRRKIQDIYSKLPMTQRTTLYLLFGSDIPKIDLNLSKIYHTKAPIVYQLSNYKEIIAICHRFLISNASVQDKMTITDVRIDINLKINRAINSYLKVKEQTCKNEQ